MVNYNRFGRDRPTAPCDGINPGLSMGRPARPQLTRTAARATSPHPTRHACRTVPERFYKQSSYSIGFRYTYGQVRRLPRQFSTVLRYLEKNQVVVLHNIREHLLRVHLSRLSARSATVYRAEVKAAPTDHLPLAFRPIFVPGLSSGRAFSGSLPYIYEGVRKTLEERKFE